MSFSRRFSNSISEGGSRDRKTIASFNPARIIHQVIGSKSSGNLVTAASEKKKNSAPSRLNRSLPVSSPPYSPPPQPQRGNHSAHVSSRHVPQQPLIHLEQIVKSSP